MTTLLAAAAQNNADWCDAFCRPHGVDGSFSAGIWAAAARTPPLYPDAITLRPGVHRDDVMRRVEPGAGCSVKDSFADLDLDPLGFRVLFEAEWVHCVRAPPPREHWSVARDDAQLAAWTAAWGEQSPGFFPTVLVGDPAVRFLLLRSGDGTIRAGAIANRSADVVGLSNLFGATGHVWADAAAAAQNELGALPVVSYTNGSELVAAHLAGFESLGPLRVWFHHTAPA